MGMKPAERHVWIRDWIANHGSGDVMDSDFVAAYIQATGAACAEHFYGAATCRQLGRDLSQMFKAQTLTRSRIGLTEHHAGMPNWVYVYDVKV